MKQKIAVDVDDVLLDFTRALIGFHNSMYNTSLRRKDFSTYDLEKVFEVTFEEKTKRMNLFYESPYFFNLVPIKDARESLSLLSRENEIIIITSRPKFIQKETEKSLERYFNGSYSDIFYSAGYYQPGGIPKSKICLNQGVSFLIDDCLKFVVECNSLGISSFLIDTPWNQQDVGGTLIARVKGWKEILEKIKESELVGKLG